MSTQLDNPAPGPALTVLRGHPSDEELAALIGVLTALPREVEDTEPTARRTASWTDPGLRLRVRRSWRDTAVPARRGTER